MSLRCEPELPRKTRKISRILPPEIDGEPPSEPPYLNATASWYSGDAWFLFAEIAQRCGLPTAKSIFSKCVQVAEKQEKRADEIKKAKDARRDRAPINLPSITQINTADRRQVSIWWARLRGTDQKFNKRDKSIIGTLAKRYVELGGYTKDFNENQLPPIKKRGSVMRGAPSAELPALFDGANPHSKFSIEKAKRGGKLTQREFAEQLVAGAGPYGKNVDSLLANLRYRRRAKK